VGSTGSRWGSAAGCCEHGNVDNQEGTVDSYLYIKWEDG
jgi:hypothetical protein